MSGGAQGLAGPQPATDAAPARARVVALRVADAALRAAGGLVSLAGGLLVAVLALLWLPFRVDTWFGLVRVPFSVLVAAAGVVALLWFAPRATGTRWGVLLPAVGWFAVTMAAVGSTREGGRLVTPDDWLAALTLFTGTVVLVVGIVLTVSTSARRPSAGGPPSAAGRQAAGRAPGA